AATFGIYLHYYVGLTLIAINLWFVLYPGDLRRFSAWCAAQFTILALYLPGLALLLRHLTLRLSSTDGHASLKHLVATPMSLLFGRPLVWKGDGAAAVIGAISLAIVILATVATLWWRDCRDSKQRLLFVLLLSTPMVVAGLLAAGGNMQAWDDRKAIIMLAP